MFYLEKNSSNSIPLHKLCRLPTTSAESMKQNHKLPQPIQLNPQRLQSNLQVIKCIVCVLICSIYLVWAGHIPSNHIESDKQLCK